MINDEGVICQKCKKPVPLCVCTNAHPLNKKQFFLNIKQPQEQDKELGTAGILCSMLENVHLEIALSRPGLKAILKKDVDPKQWGVLYLGAQKQTPCKAGLYALSRKGNILENTNECLKNLKGIILLDGSWSQAKALWWRNPWLLKTQRLLLVPAQRSLYGKLRKEPRKESISTLEACAQCLDFLGEDPLISSRLTGAFSDMLEKYKLLHQNQSKR